MRIAVCGGPYGNPYALRAFVADARGRGAERLYCLGDLGGFGAEVDALWPVLVDNDVECIAGNYDVAIARADPDCGCGYRDARDNAYAQLVYDHTLRTTSRAFATWMAKLPTQRRESVGGCDLHLVHGSPVALNDFWWESLPANEQRARVEASGADVICCTHSGLPWQRRVDETLVVNVGVLGKPANDGRAEVWYALLDLTDGGARAQLVPLAYDWAAQAASMRAAGLPETFAETIETGWWTTCLEVLPPRERSRGRFQLYRSLLPETFAPATEGWGDDVDDAHEQRPVMPLFGSAYFPSRLWVYTNFHCNLSCDYCAVASSPWAAPRALSLSQFTALVDEATGEGFTEVYLTGGEPFLHPDIVAMLRYCADRVETVVLTNATLLHGARLRRLRELADHPRLTVQTSLDGASPTTHEAHRGPRSFAPAVEGIRRLTELGLAPRVALTETAQNSHDVPAVRDLLDEVGLAPQLLAVRPLLRRGLSAHGVEVAAETTVPELTVTADGLHWHPAGADLASSPDMHLAGPGTGLAAGKRMVIERFFIDRLADGSLPEPYRCAV